MAYDDLYLALIAHRINSDFAQPRLRAVLGQRSRLDITKQRQAPSEPEFNPLQGHNARHWMISMGQVQGQNILEVEHRQAYHDLIDPSMGYRFGTQLMFLQGKAQLREEQLKLEQFTLMSVNSYNPINPFKTPISWGMALGWQQESLSHGQFSSEQQHGVVSANAQVGYSLADLEHKHLCYAQVKGYLQAGQVIDDGWRVGAAPTVGCLNRWSDKVQSVVQAEIPYWLEQEQWNLRLNTQLQYAFNPQHTVRVQWQYQQQQQDWTKATLGYMWFF
jgi:hypothetical protein